LSRQRPESYKLFTNFEISELRLACFDFKNGDEVGGLGSGGKVFDNLSVAVAQLSPL
jgi:hypothetical protein